MLVIDLGLEVTGLISYTSLPYNLSSTEMATENELCDTAFRDDIFVTVCFNPSNPTDSKLNMQHVIFA